MKDLKCLTKKQRDGIGVYSADGKTQYVFLRKLKNGKIVRTFYAAICDGILSEGTNCSDMEKALKETKEMINGIYKLNPRSFKNKS